ncbi:hypothetical protein PHISCL_00902 [Aspergillus sclerotialis]|uniref:Endonuclease/exonuclease/phosphatase domain-containing protein n=1 Tax=Aspergillus sclerotialis TaxID=2070753 RepID=A0A3A2ZVL4_9EURO|nr:hypothetical protein PHISCL_00902 [Aspergillus sclerotialis]
MKPLSLALSTTALLIPSVFPKSISEINGNRFLSPYQDKDVSNIKGLVTATSSKGIYIRSTNPDSDPATSESIYVYGNSTSSDVSVGDIITLDGHVSEYRSSDDYVYLTELTKPSGVKVTSGGNDVKPVVLGKDGLSPPTKQFSSLDDGNIFGTGNSSQISSSNPVLQPDKYGMDFWESLSAELVTVTNPRAVGKPNKYGDTWIVGDWSVNGAGNERGGVTTLPDDANSEAILVGSPLDGSKNPTDTKLGDYLGGNVTGIITQAYGYYALLPLTALSVSESNSTAASATTLASDGTCKAITVGSYNVNNLSPDSDTLPKIADHIANYLNGPSIIFLQEIQDDDGSKDDGVISANKTLSTLADKIKSSGGPSYNFTNINPVNDKDGGQPGGNIRVAYLYDSSIIQLRNPNPGSNKEANDVLPDGELKYNPGLIDPGNDAWDDSRKPLVAAWETVDGTNQFVTINVHLMSKLGSTSLEGDARPPVNGGADKRTEQAKVIANFTTTLLDSSPNAKIITSGDFNEFAFTEPLEVFASESGLVDLDDVVNTPATERYTYLYEQNCQQLDHIYVSEALSKKDGVKMDHVHVNTWVSYDEQGSDHDPTVALVEVCD